MPSPDHRSPPFVAVVEDDPTMGASLVQRLRIEGYETVWWRTGAEAVAALSDRRPDVLVCDIRLPDMDGEEIFRRTAPQLGATAVLFVTAHGDIDQAVRLMRSGADDYMTKPFELRDLLDRVRRLAAPGGGQPSAGTATLGRSAAMAEVEALLRRVADIDSTLLITGESGAGKEVAARLVHTVSGRAGKPFVAVNCAAIPSELMDSELFGHEKGAFTGAHARHEGYAERAGDGILFLDEIGDLQPAVQAKLLRLIQERVFTRVGGERLLPFQARVVCATNQDLDRQVAEGRFRQDLLFRINVIPVRIPPLRERRADIGPLLDAHVAYFAEAFGRPARRISDRALSAALEHPWPGNVRELRNRVERAVALCEDAVIGPSDLFLELAGHTRAEPPAATLGVLLEQAERTHIRTTLERVGGNVTEAAKLLGVSRSTLFDRVRRLGIRGGSG